MEKIIAANDPLINSTSSESILTTTNLPSFHLKILVFYYVLRISGIDKPDYSRTELAQRFKRSESYLSTCLNELEAWGLMASDPHGSAKKKRWITYAGFSMLERQPQHQIQHQINAIPYIDLLRSEIREDLKILKGPQNCEQPEEPEETQEIKPAGLIMEPIMTTALNRSHLSEERKKELKARVAIAMKENSIQSKRAYFLKALQNEERIFKYLRS